MNLNLPRFPEKTERRMNIPHPKLRDRGRRQIFAGHIAVWGAVFLLTVLVLPARRAESLEMQSNGWQSLKSGVLARLTTVFFLNEKQGWVGGTNGVLMFTRDGGESWNRIMLPESQRRESVRDLWVFESGRSLVLGEYGMFSRRAALGFVERIFVLSSADRGATWNEMQPGRPPVTEAPARIVRNSDKDLVLEPSMMKRAPDPVLLRMGFADDMHGWACGEGGTIQSTRDGGRTWIIQQTSARKLLYDLSVIDSKRVRIAGAGGTLLQTVDSGQTWVEQRTGITETIRAIEFADELKGWIASSNGSIHVTFDGGSSWSRQTVPTRQPLNDILFLNAEGWAVGDNGTMLHTLDGGKTWQDESFETHSNLMRLHFVSLDNGWIVGSNGALYKFTRSRKNED